MAQHNTFACKERMISHRGESELRMLNLSLKEEEQCPPEGKPLGEKMKVKVDDSIFNNIRQGGISCPNMELVYFYGPTSSTKNR